MMLKRASAKKKVHNLFINIFLFSSKPKYVNAFVHEISGEEKDREVRMKLDALQLSDDEWKQADLFIDLLTVSVDFNYIIPV